MPNASQSSSDHSCTRSAAALSGSKGVAKVHVSCVSRSLYVLPSLRVLSVRKWSSLLSGQAALAVAR
jgi:hypothetical protein